MSIAPRWDKRYRANEHMSVWPWSDLVSLVQRHAPHAHRVLELGCGAGANIPFFASKGCEYHAIEGSATIVQYLHNRFPEYQANIVVGDFTEGLPFTGPFDLIVDRGSLTCDDDLDITRTLSDAHRLLGNDGMLISVDWYWNSQRLLAHLEAFEIVRLDKKTIEAFVPSSLHSAETWNIVAKPKGR